MHYKVIIQKSETDVNTVLGDQDKKIETEISDTNLTALKDYLDLMKAGTDVSSVKTAIDAL